MTDDVAQIAKGLTKAQREAVLAIDDREYRNWPEARLKAMLYGLGKYGLREMRDMHVLGKSGDRYILTRLGILVRQHLLTSTAGEGCHSTGAA